MHNTYRADSLPTEAVLRSYVAALAGTQHVDSWVHRRAALAETAETTATPPTAPGPGQTSPGTDAPPYRRPTPRPGWRWWCAAAAVVVASNIITAVVVDRIATHDPKQGAATTGVATGTDPGTRPDCLRDAVVAASSQERTFLLKLLYSATCNAEWGKIERDDTLGKGNTIRLTLYRRDDPTSPATQAADEPDVQSAYTPVIVRHDPTGRICVTGSITTGTNTIEAQRPICNWMLAQKRDSHFYERAAPNLRLIRAKNRGRVPRTGHLVSCISCTSKPSSMAIADCAASS